MPVDTAVAVERCRELLELVSPQMKIYLDVALREAQLMQLVREVTAGNIIIDEDSDDE